MSHERAFESRPWRFQRKLWVLAIVAVFSLAAVKICKVKESKAECFTKVKESRRGTLRLAKERKQNIVFTQDRWGVSRHLWIQDPEGPRRQFFLEAASARVSTSLTSKAPTLVESFIKPKGWLQEELFWEVASTGDRVLKKGDTWVREAPPHRPIPEQLYQQVVPMQRVRFFDAATADWNPETNKLVANTAFFKVMKIPGHDMSPKRSEGQVIAEGSAHAMTFLFDKQGRQQVNCQGVKLHLHQGPTK